MRRRSRRRGLLRRRAIAAVEFAMIAPVVLLLIGGIVDGGLLLRAYTTVNALTMQYAVSWADCPDDVISCQTEMGTYAAADTIANVAPDLTAANLTVRMFEVTMTGATPTIVNSYVSSGPASMTAAEIAAAESVVPPSTSEYGVVVSLSYNYSLTFFAKIMAPILGSSVSISYTVAQLKSSANATTSVQ